MTDKLTTRGGGMLPLDFDIAVEMLRINADNEDEARLTQGEVAAILQRAGGYGVLKEAAKESHCEYKTLAERARVVDYYEQILPGRKLAVGESIVRDLLAEFPTLRWTHLRVAKGLDGDDATVALAAVMEAVEDAMTPAQFKRHVAKLKAANGHRPSHYRMPPKAGWQVIIRRVE